MNEERDKFLTEAMGMCWHEFGLCTSCQKGYSGEYRFHCIKCHLACGYCFYADFSTWPGFGLLWEWATKQDWFRHFSIYIKVPPGFNVFSNYYIHPDRFADILYEFLKDIHV